MNIIASIVSKGLSFCSNEVIKKPHQEV